MKTFTAPGGYQFNTIKHRTVYLHVQIAERALGKPLPVNAELHHIDGNPRNNAAGNLVICPDHRYHMLLHQRQRALDQCGNASWRPCQVCGTYGDPESMRPHYRQFYHRSCKADEARKRRAKEKAK